MTRPERLSLADLPSVNPGPVCRLSRLGVIELANDAAVKLFDGGPIVGRSWRELSPSLTEEAWHLVTARTTSHQYEDAIGDRDFIFTIMHRDGGDHVYVSGTDVTSLKAAERSLQDQAAELAELARFPDMNPGPVFRVELDGTVLLANRAARQLWGDDALAGRSLLELCRDLDPGEWAQAVKGQGAAHHDVDVGDRYLTFTVAREPGSDTAFVYGTDITDLKLAERRLEQQAADLAELARFPEMNPGPVCRLDREACIVLANRAARELFDDVHLVGKCWLDLCPGMDAAGWDGVLSATSLRTHTTRVNGRDLVFAHTPGADGHFVFVYGADITDQRAAERALRQSDKLATLGTLAAGVAHELNNPAAAAQRAAKQMREALAELQRAHERLYRHELTDEQRQVLGKLDERAREQAACGCDLDALALSDREAQIESWLESVGVGETWEIAPHLASMAFETGDLDELAVVLDPSAIDLVVRWVVRAYAAYALLEEIREGSARVSEIVSALRAYSYVGQAPVQAVDVNEGVRNTLIILRSKLKPGVTVEQEFGDLPKIQGYGSELNQVWTNLIDNAVQAMEGAGRIRIRTTCEGERAVVTIEDTGPGIPPDIQPHIFDPFFTTKPPGEGTGLGLHTCYDIIVKKHGGTIDVASQPGSTTFMVGLPVGGITASA